MKSKHPRSLYHFSTVFLTATSLAVFSPLVSYADPGISPKVTQTQLLADEALSSDAEQLPEPIKIAVLQDISQRTGIEVSQLQIIQSQQQSWSNSCLGLTIADTNCTEAEVRGWQVVVLKDQQVWVYRTDESGTLAKLDEDATQFVNAMIRGEEATSRRTTSRTVEKQTTRVERNTQVVATSSSAKGKKTGFSLAILQPSGNFSDVIARVSYKAKRHKGFLPERFLGDFKYKLNRKAKFAKGLKAGDRVVVRLYDLQKRFIGYSEFELSSDHTAVNLILSDNPAEYQVVRTVCGVDADEDGTIDTNTTAYDYFTQVSNERVTFLSSSQTINISQFQAEGFSTVPTNSVYPTSFRTGEFTLVRQTMNVFSYNLAEALKVEPGRLVEFNEISNDDNSIYDIGQLMMTYREIGVGNGIQVKFADVGDNYWAKDFIAELAALQIIQGFPDGNFRPDEQLTRAQFAAMLTQAFAKAKVRNAISFRDVSTRYWAYNAIRDTYAMGFLGVSGNNFKPMQTLSRSEVLLALAQGLNYTFSGSTQSILAVYQDAASIRSDVRNAIAALTERGIIVNYPNVQTLNADKVATRAEVAALIYKTLASTGDVFDISSQYAIDSIQQRAEVDRFNRTDDDDNDDKKVRRHCNQGIGNGSEGCDPGNSRPHGGSNDEDGRTPGRPR
ncbi:S-layer homology domain-containing protein [Aliinostoc sp. HNIBRCY26]|uniref:S-layer homology domain-containing protein n=1 Tax=Aliinostoc sp. HNIBRCY26 TaxID=3418997 RepID=UPI003D00E985